MKAKASLYIGPLLIALHWLLILYVAYLSVNPHPLCQSLALLFVLQKRTGIFFLVLPMTSVSVIKSKEILFLLSVLVPDTQTTLPAVKKELQRQIGLVSSDSWSMCAQCLYMRRMCAHWL